MAAFRRNIASFLSDNTESAGSDHENDMDDVFDNDRTENESPDTFAEHAEEVDTEEEEEQNRLGRALELQGSASLKRKQKKKQGRKSFWPVDSVNELVGVICEDEYYRKKLIFTNNKAMKNSEIYAKVLKDAKNRLAVREETFPFTIAQIRVKFKACISICKKAAMTRKTASGIDNFINDKGYGSWFKKLYPFIESRDSCNPDKGIEPPFEKLSQEMDSSPESSSVSNDFSSYHSAPKEIRKDLHVPVPRKRAKKDTTNSILKEAVTAFNNFVAKDSTECLLAYFREENEKSRQHERELAQMQMQMWQTMLMATAGQQKTMQSPIVNPQLASMTSSPRNMNDSLQFTGLRNMQMPTSSARGNNNEDQCSTWLSYIGQNDHQQF